MTAQNATRLVFMGSPEFAVPALRALHTEGYAVAAAISQPDRPAGRGSKMQMPAVKLAALELGIETFQPESLKDEDTVERLASYGADLFVVAAYGKILPRVVLALPERGCLNIHGSLLPRWRGPSPISAAILAGDAETGVSIMELLPKMDAGPVIASTAIPIRAEATTGEITVELAELGAATLLSILPAWLRGALPAAPQDASLVTYCHLVSKSDGQLRASMTLEEAGRAVRAYNPWPGAFVTYRGDRLSIWRAHDEVGESSAGAFRIVDRMPAIGFSGGWLILDELQRTGSKRVTGEQFVNGERGALAPNVGLA